MIVGWKECHSEKWTTAYTGYLMSTSKEAEPICVDDSPEQFVDDAPVGLGPVLDLVRTGPGFWYDDKPIPCTVCVKEYITDRK